MKVHPFVEAEKLAGHSVNNACRLLEVSRSAFYARSSNPPSMRAVAGVELLEQIRFIHAESKGTYGSPRVHQELAHRQVNCGKRRVRRLMRLAAIEGRCKKRYRKTTTPDPAAELARDLIQREFGPCEEINRRCVGDISYLRTWEGWLYLATVIDAHSRRVIGWIVDEHMRADLVEDALSMAITLRVELPERVIFHTDRSTAIRAGLDHHVRQRERTHPLDGLHRSVLGL